MVGRTHHALGGSLSEVW
ncbi:rCG30439 [Rattus norvegicus]|uniref:RCG30439 n=1 Tax=Rattus norvegicus TaxID=10116 RepID=A6JFJ1_RAT|nr:rCG30439 [Rattus norvegicus]